MKHIMPVLLSAFLLGMPHADLKAAGKDGKVNVNKEISKAKRDIKSGSNLEAVEKNMRSLLKDSVNANDKRIWLTLFESVKKQYEQINEKLYLKQQSDTAKFFSHTLNMFQVLESLDSVDARPNEKGVSSPQYRKDHSAYLKQFTKNLFGGGGYYLRKQDYAKAYTYFSMYVDCIHQPLFVGHKFNDKHISEAAYWATLCGYKMNRPDIVEKYATEALRDESREMFVLQYMAEAYASKGDIEAYGEILERGFGKYPNSTYFFPRLAVYYDGMAEHDKVLAIADKVLATDKSNKAALLAKSSCLFHKEEYLHSIKYSDEVIREDATQDVAYLNAGLSYYNMGLPLASKAKLTAKEKQELTSMYRLALPYLEKYRELKPEAKEVWLTPLYNIYLNLNMGDEFEEIENMM